MRRNEFKTYHPVVNLLYFVFVIGFSMVFMHPVCLGISFLAGYVYLPVLKGTEKSSIKPFIRFAGVFNNGGDKSGV